MKLTPNGHNYLKFSLKESVKSGLILYGNFDGFKEILVQVNKAAYDSIPE